MYRLPSFSCWVAFGPPEIESSASPEGTSVNSVACPKAVSPPTGVDSPPAETSSASGSDPPAAFTRRTRASASAEAAGTTTSITVVSAMPQTVLAFWRGPIHVRF